MRIRTIKPEFWTDSFMVRLPPFARLFFISMLSVADDHGFIEDEPDRIAMQVMPREDPMLVQDWLDFFIASGKIETLASEDGKTFLRITNWEKHQRVDKPSKSRLFREGSRKVAITCETRRKVAEKYNCQPGQEVSAACYYCGQGGKVHWHKDWQGKPTNWVTFPGLELDHQEAEFNGGDGGCFNIVLSCRSCNRSKGTKDWVEFLCKANLANSSIILASPRESSLEEGIRDQGSGNGMDGSCTPTSASEVQLRPDESKPKRAAVKQQTPDEIIAELSQNPAYKSLDVQNQFWKMKAWCDLNRRQPTKRMFLNWLNRADRPIEAIHPKPSQRTAVFGRDFI